MKKIIASIILFITIFLCIPSSINVVHADTGPKPDMEIVILNLEKSDYIVAYGTQYDTYMGPHHAFIPGDEKFGETSFGDIQDLTLVYNNVTLPEGWYLCDISSSYSNTTKLTIKSGYMWPSEFILIIYDEINSKYYLSEETETYAFHSYFEYDMNNYNKESITLTLGKSYNYSKEILGFFVRLILTLAIEMLLALAFKFNKKSFLIILIANILTQVGLNVALNVSAHFVGKSPWHIFIYALIEVLIFIIEAAIYKKLCKRGKSDTKKWIITYALLANVLSFSLGMILWFFI